MIAHLLPALAGLVAKVLRLPEKDTGEAKRPARLDRQVTELREGAKEAKRVLAADARERDRLSGWRFEGSCAARSLARRPSAQCA